MTSPAHLASPATPHPGGRPPTPLDVERIRRLHAEGLSERTIATLLGTSHRTVARRLATRPASSGAPAPQRPGLGRAKLGEGMAVGRGPG